MNGFGELYNNTVIEENTDEIQDIDYDWLNDVIYWTDT